MRVPASRRASARLPFFAACRPLACSAGIGGGLRRLVLGHNRITAKGALALAAAARRPSSALRDIDFSSNCTIGPKGGAGRCVVCVVVRSLAWCVCV